MARYDGLRYGHRATGDGLDGVESLYAATRSQAFNQIVRGRILAGNYFIVKEYTILFKHSIRRGYIIALINRNYEKYFVQALKLRRLIYQDYVKVWRDGIDLLLTPVTLSDAPLYSEYTRKDSRAQSAEQVSKLIWN